MVRATMAVNPRMADLPRLMELDHGDLSRILVQVDSRFIQNERSLFASEGASGGEKWQELSPTYAKWKRKRFPGRKILQRKGDLRRSLTNRGGEHVAYVHPYQDAVVIGSESRYGVYHAPGEEHNPKLPVRDPIQHTDIQVGAYRAIFRDYLVNVKLRRVASVLNAAFGLRGSRAA